MKYGWIYLETDTEWRIKTERGSVLPRASIAETLELVTFTNRKAYIDLIGRLSKLNAPNDPLLWWSSELAAKNPYNKLYTRICLNEIKHAIDISDYVIVQSEELLAEKRRTDSLDALPMIPGLELLSSDYKKYVTSRVDYRNRFLREREIPPFEGDKTAMLVTWADARNINGGKYKDPHFGNLPFFLKERGYNVSIMPRVLYNSYFDDVARGLIDTGEHIYFPEQFISGLDYSRALQKAREFSPIVPDDASIGKTKVKPFIDVLVEESRGYHAKSLLYDPMVKRMAELGVKPSRLYYTCEGHAWEAALVHSVRKYMPDTKIIAYDNGTFSTMNLAMFPSADEFSIRPMPDKIVTSGEMYARTLRVAGYPDIVKVGCGLRHQYFFDGTIPNRYFSTHETTAHVLVATSIDYGETLEMIDKAITGFQMAPNMDIVYIVIIKLHPMIDKKKILDVLGELPNNVFISDKPISELLQVVDVILYGYSLVCFEALANGVYPIFVKNENALNLDKLDGLGVSSSVAHAFDIRDAAETFLKLSIGDKKGWAERAKKVCRDALGEIDGKCIEKFE
jgi:hypothetical protein